MRELLESAGRNLKTRYQDFSTYWRRTGEDKLTISKKERLEDYIEGDNAMKLRELITVLEGYKDEQVEVVFAAGGFYHNFERHNLTEDVIIRDEGKESLVICIHGELEVDTVEKE